MPIIRRSLWLAVILLSISFAFADDPAKSLELSRPVRPWEFMSSLGQRAAVIGNESGDFEAWVYPFKILRDFHLTFHVAGLEIPGRNIARTITVRPESTSILYSYDQFSVLETIIVPVNETGAIIRLQTSTFTPLQIEATFTNDMQLMWPAGLGNIWPGYDDNAHAFTISGDPYFAIIGSPGAVPTETSFITNYGSSNQSAFRLPEIPKGKSTNLIVIAGSIHGQEQAHAEYKKLLANADQLEQDSAQYYRDYLARTASVDIPSDPDMQHAYDWARVSVAQAIVNSPYLGEGLVAGYRTSGDGARPGFAWFFGRDSEWTDLALDAEGDFQTAKTALEFLMKYQRDDGKVPHEISQTATLTNWWKAYPYTWAAADATPLLIIAADDYVTNSGDVGFASANWDHLWRAYRFLKSTYDPQGFARNEGVGTGWVEGGPLVPIHSELYQNGLAIEAERSLAHLASLNGKTDIAQQLRSAADERLRKVEDKFWIPAKNTYAFGIGTNGQMNETTSVLGTVPMWFDLLNQQNSNAMIDQLASSAHSTDWGMRILGIDDPLFSPDGYHFGAVWPLFTGWASVGEYRYHRSLAAYQNLRENALLTLNGALGHTTEVLSGTYYQQHSIASPHQIWSAAMVINPLLRGLMGLSNDAERKKLIFAPHVPAAWTHFSVNHVPLASGTVDLSYFATENGIDLTVEPYNTSSATLEFSPAVSPNAQVTSVEVNGRKAQFKVDTSLNDKHVLVDIPALKSTIKIFVKNNFVLTAPAQLPELGMTTQNIKPISEKWTGDQVEYVFEGLAGHTYFLPYAGNTMPSSAVGATVNEGRGVLAITFPRGNGYVKQRVVLQFKEPKRH